MPSLKKSLFIGLGGTGVKSILYAKAKIKAIYGEIPPMVRFLALDTDKFEPIRVGEGEGISLEANEYVHMQVPDGLQFIKANDHAAEFFPEKNLKNAGAIIRGAGQIRSLGRLALMRNYHTVKKRIDEEILQLRNYSVGYNDKFTVSGNDLQISIVCSTSGGTGAGTFLDIPYIIKNTGQLTTQDRMIAYLLLPDIFRQYSGTRNVEPNCYASFKELDFLMDGHLEGSTINYGRDQKVSIVGHPYDVIFTINNLNNKNDAYTETSDLYNFIGTGLFISTGIISEKGDSTWDNLGKQIDDFLNIEGKSPHFCSFGISELYYNGDTLANVFSRKLGLNIISQLTGGVDDLTKTVNEKIDEWQIREDQDKDEVIDAILSRTTNRSPETLEKFGKGASAEAQTIATNFINAITDLAETTATENYNELVKNKMADIEAYIIDNLNQQNGITYVLSFLDKLFGKTEAFKADMEVERKEILERRAKLHNSLEGYVADILDAEESFFLKRKSNVQIAVEEYMNVVLSEANLIHELKRREKGYQFYNKISQFIEEKRRKLEVMKSDLGRIFRNFEEFVSSEENRRGTTKPFIINLHEEFFDRTQPAPDDLSINDFINYLKENEKQVASWTELRVEELENILLTYAHSNPKAAHFKERTLDSVLRELSVEKKRQLIQQLDRRAEPLWRYNKSFILETATIYLIGLNSMDDSALFDEEEGRQLIETIPGRKTFAVTNEPNRVYFYKMEASSPAFTIFNMQMYKQKFENVNARYDYHIDRNWAKLIDDRGFDLFPGGEDEENILSWALGNAFGLIVKEGRKQYKIKSYKEGTPTNDYWVSLESEDRKEAFRIFDKRKVFRELNDLLEKEMEQRGKIDFTQTLDDYLETFMDRVKEYTSLDEKTINSKGYQEVKELIDMELTVLKQYANSIKSGF